MCPCSASPSCSLSAAVFLASQCPRPERQISYLVGELGPRAVSGEQKERMLTTWLGVGSSVEGLGECWIQGSTLGKHGNPPGSLPVSQVGQGISQAL